MFLNKVAAGHLYEVRLEPTKDVKVAKFPVAERKLTEVRPTCLRYLRGAVAVSSVVWSAAAAAAAAGDRARCQRSRPRRVRSREEVQAREDAAESAPGRREA